MGLAGAAAMSAVALLAVWEIVLGAGWISRLI